MKQNNSFFTTIRRKLFGNRINGEIFDKIFPHLNRTADHGYPFHSDDEMVEQHIRSGLDAQMKFDMIERTAAKMPKAYGDAFRYIAYRDLNERMEMYLEIAKERIQPKAGTPHLATVAHSA
jgi:hypothetical protein